VRQCYSVDGEMLEKERPDLAHNTAPPQVQFDRAAMAFNPVATLASTTGNLLSYTNRAAVIAGRSCGRKPTVLWARRILAGAILRVYFLAHTPMGRPV
jgi:hypothetical protein